MFCTTSVDDLLVNSPYDYIHGSWLRLLQHTCCYMQSTTSSRLSTFFTFHCGVQEICKLQQRYYHKLSRQASNPPLQLAGLVCTVGWAQQVNTTLNPAMLCFEGQEVICVTLGLHVL